MMYLTACPFVLWASLGWWTPLAAVLITFLLLGTENIGVQVRTGYSAQHVASRRLWYG